MTLESTVGAMGTGGKPQSASELDDRGFGLSSLSGDRGGATPESLLLPGAGPPSCPGAVLRRPDLGAP